jgi:hypothetical protein
MRSGLPVATPSRHPHHFGTPEDEWLQAPFGEDLLTDLDRWRARGKSYRAHDVIIDYNRVDPFRLGIHAEYGLPRGLAPRLGARFEYAFGRDRALYGLQVEQPADLAAPVLRRTHLDRLSHACTRS